MSTGSDDHDPRVGVMTTAGSVLSAFFGVQSSRARTRDFSNGSPALFIAIAVALTLTFAATLAIFVRVIAAAAGGG